MTVNMIVWKTWTVSKKVAGERDGNVMEKVSGKAILRTQAKTSNRQDQANGKVTDARQSKCV